MTYYDSAEDTRVTATRAAKEIRAHGTDPSEFFDAVPPDHDGTYDAQTVLAWLGY